jgi:hypothetical protein
MTLSNAPTLSLWSVSNDRVSWSWVWRLLGAGCVDVDNVVVGVVWGDLVFELVVEREGLKKYWVRQDTRRLKRTLLAS